MCLFALWKYLNKCRNKQTVAVTTPLSYQPVPLKEASIPWAVLTGMVLSCLSVFPPLFCSTASPAVWWTVRRGWHFLPVYLVMNSPMILGFTSLLSILITPTRPAFMLCM